MKTIYITGASGFVGKNFINRLHQKYLFTKYIKNTNIVINEFAVLHFAGLAHDLLNTKNSNDYYEVNTNLTKEVFNVFLNSSSEVFIFLSSVKAVADELNEELTEDFLPNPKTDYGKSKLLAEKYILNELERTSKRIYILRPCMIHGPENKGNLNLLYNLVKKGIPWPLKSYINKRSYCNIDNLIFIINELINNDKIPSGIYNVADDDSISTTELVKFIGDSMNKKIVFLKIPKTIIRLIFYIGDLLNFSFNLETLKKLSETYIVSNKKIKHAIKKELPFSTKEGLFKTFKSFKKINIHNDL